MAELYRWAVTVHVISAIVWIGAMWFIGLVLAPELRRLDDEALRTRLYHRVGVRVRWIGWTAIVLLIGAGIIMLAYRGVTWGRFWSAEFLGSAIGLKLSVKLVAVAAIIVLSALHDFAWGPRLRELPPGGPKWQALRSRVAWVGRINALLALLVVVLGVRLFR